MKNEKDGYEQYESWHILKTYLEKNQPSKKTDQGMKMKNNGDLREKVPNILKHFLE